MRIEKIIAGLLFLPFVLLLFVILFPLILIFGILSLLFMRKPMGFTFIKTASSKWGTTQSGSSEQKEDIIDVEVINAENTGDQNDLSGRALR